MKNIFLISALILIMQSCINTKKNEQEALPVSLSDISRMASCVFLTKDEGDNPVVSWVETDSADNKYFFFANWSPAQKKFGPPMPIPIASNTSVHEEGMPKIAFKGDGTLVAIYETNVPSAGSRFGLSDIHYIFSFDKGETWTPPKSIQSEASSAGSRSFANILRLNDGEVGVSWLDTDSVNPNQGRPVKFARTQGKTDFGKAVLLEPFACQCCRTAISSDDKGNLNVVFRDILPGSVRDISVSTSTDNGITFRAPVSFSKDNWVLDGCPHNGPSVVSKDGLTYVAWFTGSDENGVFYGELDQNNDMLVKRQLDAEGRFVQLCLLSDGTRMVAYNKNFKDGDSMYAKIVLNKINDAGTFEKEISPEKSHASYPVIQELDDKNVIVGWSDEGKIYYTTVHADQMTNRVKTSPQIGFKTETETTVELTSETDPVCGMHLGKSTSERNTIQHNGKTVGFCGAMCKRQFLAEL